MKCIEADPTGQTNCLFQNKIIDGQIEDKIYLRKTIEAHTGRKILKSQLIFKFDPLNPTSFHTYIDNVPNLVVIVRVHNQYLLAGYSEGSFYRNMVS